MEFEQDLLDDIENSKKQKPELKNLLNRTKLDSFELDNLMNGE